MIFNYLSHHKQLKQIKAKIARLETQKKALQAQLKKTKTRDRNNARLSDRKFKENSSKALTARAKRANKSALHDIDRQIKSTKRKLNDIRSLSNNQPMMKLKKWLMKLTQPLKR